MFGSLVIADRGIDHGAIVEALIYYGRVSISTDGHRLAKLVSTLGFDNLLRCIERGSLELIYSPAQLAIQNPQTGGSLFSISQISVVPEKLRGGQVNNPTSLADDLEDRFIREFGSSRIVKKQARDLTERCRPFEFFQQVTEGAKNDILDRTYLTEIIRSISEQHGMTLPDDFRLVTKEFDKRILFNANVDYEKLGTSPSGILVNLISVREQLIHSAARRSEVWVDPKLTGFIEAKINSLATPLIAGRESIRRFQEVKFKGRSFRAAVNSDAEVVKSVVELLDKPNSVQFKSWLNSLPPSAELMTEYDRAVFGENPVLRSIPYKAVRSLLLIGMGASLGAALDGSGTAGIWGGAIAGEALSHATDFLQEKFLQGWRPDQFIDGEATALLDRHPQ